MTPQPSRYYLDRQQEHESNARTYPRRLPLAIKSAQGVQVKDVDGKVYFDCLAGAGALALGHNHPVVVEAVRRHLDEGVPWQTLDLTTPTKERFVAELFASLPRSFAAKARIQFCGPSGSDAVEAALKLVKIATGRRAILAFHGGYHGQTHGALATMGNVAPKTAVPGLMPDVHHLPYPYAYRCPLGCGSCDGRHVSEYVERVLDDPYCGIAPAAGMIVEVVQGEGGNIPAPDDWLRDIRRITRAHGIPLIIDEVQTGWGRTGMLYAFERAGIEPDVVVLSKAIGGGLPLAVVVYDEALDGWKPGAHAGTFRGNQLAMAAGLATLRFLVENDLASHAERMGRRLGDRLERLQHARPFVGDVRGRGLMIGVEIVDPEQLDRWGRAKCDGNRARRIQSECFHRGLLVEVGGRHDSVLRFLPPLIVTDADLDSIGEIVEAAMTASASSNEVDGV